MASKCHIVVQPIYQRLRELAVTNYEKLEPILAQVNNSVIQSTKCNSEIPKLRQISMILVRYHSFLMKTFKTEAYQCSVHRQLFSNAGSLGSHFKVKGHLDSKSLLYQMFTLHNKRVDLYSLTSDDEQYLLEYQNVHEIDISHQITDLQRIRKFLPVIGLLDLAEEPVSNLKKVLRKLCKDIGLTDDYAEKIESNLLTMKVLLCYSCTARLPIFSG